jgi:hypothetical protein
LWSRPAQVKTQDPISKTTKAKRTRAYPKILLVQNPSTIKKKTDDKMKNLAYSECLILNTKIVQEIFLHYFEFKKIS